jgi:hypothetical protein
MVAAERRLHVVDANERLLRIDVAVRFGGRLSWIPAGWANWP